MFVCYAGQKLNLEAFAHFVHAETFSDIFGICPVDIVLLSTSISTWLPGIEPFPSKPSDFVVFDSHLINACSCLFMLVNTG